MGQGNSPLSYYVERTIEHKVRGMVVRTPLMKALVHWAKTPPGDAELADDPPAFEPSSCLLSVLAQPGGGKTMTIYHLKVELDNLLPAEHLVLLPILDLKQYYNLDELKGWFQEAVASAHLQLTNYPALERIHDVTELGEKTAWLCDDCKPYHAVVLIDGFEEASVEWRQAIEKFLTALLTPKNVRAVLTRRDEVSLSRDFPLGWNEDQVRLGSLPTPEEQIELRLALAGQVVVGWPREPWEDDLDAQIANLTDPQRIAVLNDLQGNLTPHPYLSLLLLREKLTHLDAPLSTADCDACLTAYIVERAELAADAVSQALYWAEHTDEAGFIGKNDYDPKKDLPKLEDLLSVGIAFHRKNPAAYQLDSGVLALARVRARLLNTAGQLPAHGGNNEHI